MIVLGLTLLAALLRLAFLGRHNFDMDETTSALITALGWHPMAKVVFDEESNMLLYYFVLHPWAALAGDSEFALRAFHRHAFRPRPLR